MLKKSRRPKRHPLLSPFCDMTIDVDLAGERRAIMPDITRLTAEIVASAGANKTVRMPIGQLIKLIGPVREALREAPTAEGSSATPASPLTRAQWSKLFVDGKIRSLLNGKLYTTLKRHLAKHGHDASSYRASFGLPVDFPIVSPQYSAKRSELSKISGFGGRVQTVDLAPPADRATAADPAKAKATLAPARRKIKAGRDPDVRL